MVKNLKLISRSSPSVNKGKNQFNWRLVLGISVFAAIIFGLFFYVPYIPLENRKNESRKKTNITESVNKDATKSAEITTNTTNTKENTKTVGDDTPPLQDQKLIITEKDFGQFFAINNGQQIFLRLSNRFAWFEPVPKTTGEISLKNINYAKDPGFREWQVSYTSSSTATIESNITTGTLGTDAEITKFFITLKIQMN